jgi:CO/xanthine dehydrogenase FAD-binding subunit
MPGVIMALNGEIVVRSPRAERTITADDFFLGTFTTALEPDEILTEIRFATLPVHTGTAYEKLMNKASHYAIAGCAAVITLDSKQQCKAASITITGAATQTSRATAVEKALVGQKLDTDNIQSAANHAADDLELISDIHGSEDYRRQMAIVVTRRAITNALKRV